MTRFTNLDDSQTLFFEKELDYMLAKSYDIVYPELMYDKVLPISSEVPAGAETITYRQYDMVGHAKLIHSYANDLPVVGAFGKEFTSKIYSQGVSFGYSMQDVRNAAFGNVPLNQRLANAARKAVLTQTNDLAFYGDAEAGLQGFINHPNVNYYTVPADGTSSSQAWETKTPDQILRDMNAAAVEVRSVTKSSEVVNTMILPDKQYGHIAVTPRSSTSDTTILEFFLRTSPWIKTVMPCYELEGSASNGKDCFIMYNKSPDKLVLELPQPFESFPVQEKGLYYEVPCHARFGGILVFYPKTIVQADGI